MEGFSYRCPTTGLNVQGWSADDVLMSEGQAYDTVMCLACSRVHLINRSTGRVLGSDDDE
jgi:hypothetical protein